MDRELNSVERIEKLLRGGEPESYEAREVRDNSSNFKSVASDF